MSAKIDPPDDLDGYGPAMRKLNPKQRAFVHDLYRLPVLTATKAARMAGYSNMGSTSRVKAFNLRNEEFFAPSTRSSTSFAATP